MNFSLDDTVKIKGKNEIYAIGDILTEHGETRYDLIDINGEWLGETLLGKDLELVTKHVNKELQ